MRLMCLVGAHRAYQGLPAAVGRKANQINLFPFVVGLLALKISNDVSWDLLHYQRLYSNTYYSNASSSPVRPSSSALLVLLREVLRACLQKLYPHWTASLSRIFRLIQLHALISLPNAYQHRLNSIRLRITNLLEKKPLLEAEIATQTQAARELREMQLGGLA
jgi:hypothetical protein